MGSVRQPTMAEYGTRGPARPEELTDTFEVFPQRAPIALAGGEQK